MNHGFSDQLVTWYEHNKRDLPWRHTTDPYLIWLSEVILQQTRVDQGLAYYYRFAELFPTVHTLAAAPQDEVLKAWQGLGYYSRARNLHATAQYVVGQLGGVFPTSYRSLLALKGIGPYTAAAIASFSSGEQVPVVDGNVMRVLSRFYGVYEPIDSAVGKKRIHALAHHAIQGADAARHNQAMMEFGALHCTPTRPGCGECPFSKHCIAFSEGTVQSLPVKSKKTSVKPLFLYYFVIYSHDKQTIFFRKRTNSGIWKGLHDFPCVESEVALDEQESILSFLKQHGLTKGTEVGTPSEAFTHLLSHRRITAVFIPLRVGSKWSPPEDWKPYSTGDLDKPGVPRLIDKYLSTRHILHN